MFILTQQQPQAEMCYNKEPETAFLPKDLSIAEGTIYISFLEESVLLCQITEWRRYSVNTRLLFVPVWTGGRKP